MRTLVDIHEKLGAADVVLEEHHGVEMEKQAEEDAAGRIMARGFADELNKLAELKMRVSDADEGGKKTVGVPTSTGPDAADRRTRNLPRDVKRVKVGPNRRMDFGESEVPTVTPSLRHRAKSSLKAVGRAFEEASKKDSAARGAQAGRDLSALEAADTPRANIRATVRSIGRNVKKKIDQKREMDEMESAGD